MVSKTQRERDHVSAAIGHRLVHAPTCLIRIHSASQISVLVYSLFGLHFDPLVALVAHADDVQPVLALTSIEQGELALQRAAPLRIERASALQFVVDELFRVEPAFGDVARQPISRQARILPDVFVGAAGKADG